MKPLHCLLLRLIHFEFAHWHFVLVALTAREHLVTDINVASATGKSLLKQDLVVAYFELAGRKAQLVVLEVSLLAIVCIPLAFAVATLRTTFLIAM